MAKAALLNWVVRRIPNPTKLFRRQTSFHAIGGILLLPHKNFLQLLFNSLATLGGHWKQDKTLLDITVTLNLMRVNLSILDKVLAFQPANLAFTLSMRSSAFWGSFQKNYVMNAQIFPNSRVILDMKDITNITFKNIRNFMRETNCRFI